MAVGGSGGNAGAIRAGKAFVELAMKDTGLQLGLKRAAALVASFGAAFVKVGAVGAGGLAAAAGGLALLGKSAGDRAVDFDRLSKRVGVPIDKLSAFAYAAETTGQEIGDLEGHFENFAERVFQASQGTGEAAETFKKLGINARDLIKMDPAEQLIAVADAMAKITNNTERRGILSALGSDQFQGLNDLLSKGSSGIRGLMAEAKKVGAVLDPAETKDTAAAMGELGRAWIAGKNAALSLGAAILPTADNARRFTAMTIEAIDNGRKWVAVLADQAKSFIKTELAASGLFDRFSKVNDAMVSAIDKGNVGVAFEILLAEMELEFVKFAGNLANAWRNFVGPFIDDFKNGIAQIKLSLVDVKSFAERQLLGTGFGRFVGKMAAGNQYVLGSIIGSESMKTSAEQAFAGYNAAGQDPEAKLNALADANRAERDRIIDERRAAQEADRKERYRIIADLESKIDALNKAQDKRLGDAGAPKSGMEEMADRAKQLDLDNRSILARGNFGINNFKGFFATGGSVEKQQLKEQQLTNKNLQTLHNDIREMIDHGRGPQFI